MSEKRSASPIVKLRMWEKVGGGYEIFRRGVFSSQWIDLGELSLQACEENFEVGARKELPHAADAAMERNWRLGYGKNIAIEKVFSFLWSAIC